MTRPSSASRPETAPRKAALCPLCGQPNGCAPARAGTFDVPCWCTQVQISADVLAQIPAEVRDRACLCRRCAESGNATSGPGDPS